jgi:uncharacterized protein
MTQDNPVDSSTDSTTPQQSSQQSASQSSEPSSQQPSSPTDSFSRAMPQMLKTGMFAPPSVPMGEAPQAERVFGMLCHLLALSGLVGIPLGNILGPLVMWLVKKETMPFVNDQGKEALNFNISMLILAIAITPTICLAGLGIILLIGLLIFMIVVTIIAAIKANQGIYYRYPFSARLIK